ncbi:hypothetical protein JAAARDRAFT_319873 [Jaapia argillacea MUCL 33604]|uniref:Uncharacterized protein n=1 Tax=Jaapia argillacea MUCL 33604 TaxID=933084 RepID=A0A067PXS6_9AGAM|nr:hypothetical protein JAAARDRAFT_319873 [Jaapia argillacea MUCL 33604]
MASLITPAPSRTFADLSYIALFSMSSKLCDITASLTPLPTVVLLPLTLNAPFTLDHRFTPCSPSSPFTFAFPPRPPFHSSPLIRLFFPLSSSFSPTLPSSLSNFSPSLSLLPIFLLLIPPLLSLLQLHHLSSPTSILAAVVIYIVFTAR